MNDQAAVSKSDDIDKNQAVCRRRFERALRLLIFGEGPLRRRVMASLADLAAEPLPSSGSQFTDTDIARLLADAAKLDASWTDHDVQFLGENLVNCALGLQSYLKRADADAQFLGRSVLALTDYQRTPK